MRAAFTPLLIGSLAALAVAEEDLPGRTQVAVESVYTGEVWRGANAAAGPVYLDNLDFTVEAAAQRWTLFAYVLYNNGHSVSRITDPVQGVSNIEATRDLRLHEFWYEWRSRLLPLSWRFGLYDLNSEFDAIDGATLFVHPSHGIGVDFSQSGAAGPSIFPLTSLALRADATHDGWTVRAAVLDAVPSAAGRLRISSRDGLLLVGEVNRSFNSGARIGAGHWQYTARFDDIGARDGAAPARRDDNAGMYLFGEAALPLSACGSALNAFMRIGAAEDRINAVRYYYGAGVVCSAPLGRASDQVGLAVGMAEAGAAHRGNLAADGIRPAKHETLIELTYRVVVADWLAVQPDVQYVLGAAFDASSAATWVFGLRFEIDMMKWGGPR